MKLLLCAVCMDVVALRSYARSCECGLSAGRYLDRLWAEVEGPCLVLGTRNDQIRHALRVEHEPRVGPNYRWWVVNDGHHVVRRRTIPEGAR